MKVSREEMRATFQPFERCEGCGGLVRTSRRGVMHERFRRGANGIIRTAWIHTAQRCRTAKRRAC